MPDPGRTALYRLYDANDQLLYVGIATDPKRRWVQHSLDKRDSWWSDVDRKTVHWFDSRSEADAAETLAIREERPLRNRSKTPAGQMVEFCTPKLPPAETRADMYKPRSLRVAEALRCEFEADAEAVVPSGRLIASRFGISHVTANKVLQHLAAQGVICRHGRTYRRSASR